MSVVVPTPHRPGPLRLAVESVLAQEYAGDVEVIVVFDGETPYSPTVQVPDGRTLRVTPNLRRAGLAGARNTGIELAGHDLVAFLDDDDIWLPGKLARQSAVFTEHPGVILVAAAIVVDDGVRTHDRLLPMERVTHADLLRDSFAGLHPSGFLLDRVALLERVGLVDEDIPSSYGEDYDLVLRTASIEPIRVVNAPLVRVTWTGQSHFFGRWGVYADGLTYLLAKHPGFRADRRAHSRIAGQIAFCRAAAGDRRAGARWALASLVRGPTELRSWLALAIAGRLLSAPWVVRTIQRRGRGI